MKTDTTLFENDQIRRVYDEESETWWFSVVDVIRLFTQQPDYQSARKHWSKLKERLGKEGSQSVTICHRLNMAAADGTHRPTDYWIRKCGLHTILCPPSVRSPQLAFTISLGCATRTAHTRLDKA